MVFRTPPHAVLDFVADDADVGRVRQALVPIFDQFSVDLVIGGHDHGYARSKPLRGPAENPMVESSSSMGTIYVVSAGAGADPHSPGSDRAPYREMSAAFGGSTGYAGLCTLLRLDGTTPTVTTHGLEASSSNVLADGVIDSFTATR